MAENLNIFFSNRLEVLYQNLKMSLFGFSKKPFMKRLVIVYGPAMKNWIMLQLAKDPELGIATGIEFIYLNESFNKITELFQLQTNHHLPSRIELALAIEVEIRDLLKNYDSLSQHDKQVWEPLKEYFKLYTSSASSRTDKRIIGLAQQMTQCFLEYGQYAGQLIEQWETHSEEIWQQALWKRLFSKHTDWTYPFRLFQEKCVPNSNIEIHFFSISFINQIEFNFLQKLPTPIFYYLLSPCAVFWSDLHSAREKIKLESYWQKKFGTASVKDLEEQLRDRNHLLANFGRLGREMAILMDESQSQIHPQYVLPSSVIELTEEVIDHEEIHLIETNASLSLLQAVQADLLLMRNPKTPFNFSHADDSIQLHSVPTKRREIEILYQNILGLFNKSSHLSQNDIIVMSPQISEYIPYIKSIFGAKNSQLNFQILDEGANENNKIIPGFLNLINLSTSRWEASDLLQLFEYHSFQKRHNLTINDFRTITKWIEEVGIRWGFDLKHRSEILARNHCENEMVESTNVGTWEYGLQRLLQGYAIKEDAVQDIIPYDKIEFSQSELIGKLILILTSLKDDLTPLIDYSEMTLDHWSSYLECLLNSYFQIEPSNSEAAKEYEFLKEQITRLRSFASAIQNESLSFISVKVYLLDLLQNQRSNVNENHSHTIRFCSLLPLRSIPSKVIALVGMQEGAYPRKNHPISLNLRTNFQNHTFCPSAVDYDRYLFLDILHGAYEHLIISYLGYDYKNNKEMKPSLIIEELVSYLDQHYTIQNKSISQTILLHHPFDAFDASYFSSDSLLNNFSQTDYKAAETYYLKEKQSSHSIIKDFAIKIDNTKLHSNNTIIDLKNLTALAKNPFKFHLNNKLNIYLQTAEDRAQKNEENLITTSLDAYFIKQESLNKSFESVFRQAQKEGKLPLGMFQNVSKNKLKEEMKEIEERLNNYQIKNIYEIEFISNCVEPTQINERKWLLPAIKHTLENGNNIQIIGHLRQVTSKGLLAMSKGSLADSWKMWPQFLAFQYALKALPGQFDNQLIQAFQTKPKISFIPYPEPYLKQFINYYAASIDEFSPLMPEWISPIFEGNEKALDEKIHQVFSDYNFTYSEQEIRWLTNKNMFPSGRVLIEQWQNTAKELVSDIVHHWHPKKNLESEGRK